jgi:threonine dehydrogenase-like Zn-dependent dehydrogenase
MGAEMVVAIDASAERLEAARALGADRTVDVTEVIDPADRIERVKELTDGGGDLVLEVAGVRGVVSEGVRMVQRGGRYVEVGQIVHGGDRIEMPALALVTRNLSLLGVALYDPGVLDEVVDMLFELRGDPTLARLTGSRRYPLERLEEAFAGGDGAAGAARPVIELRDGGAQ